MSLCFHNIEKFFSTKDKPCLPVLDQVNFTVNSGEFVVLLGPSGCGKSTLLHMAAGLTAPNSGQVLWNGKQCLAPSLDRAVVFQESGLFPWLTVLENICFAMKEGSRSAKEKLAIEYLRLIKMENFVSNYPHQLSGGMKQRVAIVRALATQSSLLLMDEPFAALDEYTRQQLQRELLDLWQQTGKTILFVTHHIREALLLADRILVFSQIPTRLMEEIPITVPHPRHMENHTLKALEEKLLSALDTTTPKETSYAEFNKATIPSLL